jgi:hypothetical protein
VIRRPFWPPLYATAFFLPRVKLRITNDGPAIDAASIAVDACESDGPIGAAPSITDGWLEAHNEPSKPWPTGEAWRFTFTIAGRTIPRPGTYIVRIRVTRWRRQGPPEEELSRQLREQAEGKAAPRATEFLIKQFAEGEPREARRAEQVFAGTVIDYFRVEPLSSVLTFAIATGSLLAALASLTLALVALFG